MSLIRYPSATKRYLPGQTLFIQILVGKDVRVERYELLAASMGVEG